MSILKFDNIQFATYLSWFFSSIVFTSISAFDFANRRASSFFCRCFKSLFSDNSVLFSAMGIVGFSKFWARTRAYLFFVDTHCRQRYIHLNQCCDRQLCSNNKHKPHPQCTIPTTKSTNFRAFSVPRQSVMRPASIDADGRYYITTVILLSKLLHVEQFVILNHELLYMVTKKFWYFSPCAWNAHGLTAAAICRKNILITTDGSSCCVRSYRTHWHGSSFFGYL